MKARSFVVLSALTLAMVVAAAVAVMREQPAQSIIGAGEKVFPRLAQQLDRIAAIVIEGAHGTITVEQTGQGWAIRERGDYPASFEKVKAAVLDMLDLQKSEAKTTRPENFARLGVEALDQPGAKSRKITLLDAAGKPVASVIVGRPVFDLGGEGSTYIRIPDSDQVWLAHGAMNFGTETRDWIDRRIVDVLPAEVRQVHVVRPDGSTLTIDRRSPTEGPWQLLELPKDTHLKRPEILDSMASAIATAEAEDVMPSAQAPGGGKPARLELETFDSLRLSGTIVEEDGESWLRLSATPASAVTDDPSVEARAAAINARVEGWAFRVPAWKVDPLLKPLADLIGGDGAGDVRQAPR